LAYESTWEILLVLALGALQLGCLIALIIDMWRQRTGAIDRLVWILVFILFGIVGSMLYLAAHRSRAARAVILIQLLVIAVLLYLVSAANSL